MDSKQVAAFVAIVAVLAAGIWYATRPDAPPPAPEVQTEAGQAGMDGMGGMAGMDGMDGMAGTTDTEGQAGMDGMAGTESQTGMDGTAWAPPGAAADPGCVTYELRGAVWVCTSTAAAPAN